jgi:hypothetical protein
MYIYIYITLHRCVDYFTIDDRHINSRDTTLHRLNFTGFEHRKEIQTDASLLVSHDSLRLNVTTVEVDLRCMRRELSVLFNLYHTEKSFLKHIHIDPNNRFVCDIE